MPGKSYDTVNRLEDLLNFIRNSHLGRTFKDIRDEFGQRVSRRTLYRDLDRLSITSQLTNDEENGVVTWKDIGKKTSVPPLTFSLYELFALKIAQGLLTAQFHGTELKKWVDSLYEKIDRSLPAQWRNILEQLGEDYNVFQYGMKDYSLSSKYLSELIDSITWRRSLKIKYKPQASKNTHEYLLDPYSLVSVKGGLYVVGYSHGHKEVRTLAVERIKELKKIGRKIAYDIPQDFSLEKHFEGAFGVVASKPEDVKIKFDRILEEYLCERKWPGLQKIEKKKGYIIVSMKIGITRELISWILSCGAHAEVIEPEELKKKVKEDAQKILRKYK
jgi:proteasome accessory factor B